MVTQTIRVNLNQKDLETILAVQSDTLREIAFEFYATDAEEAVQLNPDDFTVKFNVLKPDNNFVMTTFTDGVIKLSDQITAVTGTGYYCILLMQDDELIYSGNGKIIINDHVIGTENIDSVSEADGYTFPDDFYTKDTPLAVLDDSTTSTTSTWSSNKINGEINTASTSAIVQLNAMKTGFDGVVYDSPEEMVTSCDGILLDKIEEIYETSTVDDIYGSNAAVAGKDSGLISGAWDSSQKELNVTMSSSGSSSDTYYVMLKPKTVSGHTYKLVVQYEYPTEGSYSYIRNVFSLSNMNNRDNIVNGTYKTNNTKEVYTFTASNDGWIAFGRRVSANVVQTWKFKTALYDVTGMTDLVDSDFLNFDDHVTVGTSGVLAGTKGKADYSYMTVKNMIGKNWTALGDSLTATGSGSPYLGYVKNTLKLTHYYNCGIGGTSVSGAENVNAMYRDVRIEALNIASDCVTILAGTNDAWQAYYAVHPNTNMTGWGDCVRTNHDVSTFCGAYNVMISKILYKFCKVAGYYGDVDYSNLTQVDTAVNNFRLVLITPPQAFHVEGDTMPADVQIAGLKAVHSYVKQIAELWGLPCVDSWEMGMNDMNKALFFANYLTDATHFNAFGHERLASLIIDKALQISRYN